MPKLLTAFRGATGMPSPKPRVLRNPLKKKPDLNKQAPRRNWGGGVGFSIKKNSEPQDTNSCTS